MFVWGPAVLLAAALVWFGLPVLHRSRMTADLSAVCAQHRAIVLTYDDGPSAGMTPALADLLAQTGTKATFFVIGNFAGAAPQIVARLAAEGHEIGSHTQTHSNAWKTTPWAAMRDLVAGRQTLTRLGIATKTFRPPFGKSTLGTLIAGRGQYFAFWTVDPQDSWNRRPVADVLAEIDRKGGGVVLMHDVERPRRGPTPEAHPAYLLELTGALITFAAAKGYRILRLGDLRNASETGATP
jgi:peptidoglycan-N-acetylglucosamine deacetylase